MMVKNADSNTLAIDLLVIIARPQGVSNICGFLTDYRYFVTQSALMQDLCALLSAHCRFRQIRGTRQIVRFISRAMVKLY